MKQEKISDALEHLPEEMLEEAGKRRGKRRGRGWLKAAAVAACLCLAAAGVWNTLERLDYTQLGAACGGSSGIIVEGIYYYFVPHQGVMRYVPGGESRLEVHTYWIGDQWEVNQYGIYWVDGLGLYVRDHETGKRRQLYAASCIDCTHIRFTLREDGDVIFIGYNKNARTRYELLLDGATGQVLEQVMEPTKWEDFDLSYSEAHRTIGGREVVLTPLGQGSLCGLTEDGVDLLPEGMRVSGLVEYWGDALWLRTESEDTEEGMSGFVILYPDGRTEFVELPGRRYEGGTTEYLFYSQNNSRLWCTEVATGETWELDMDAVGDFHDLRTDGEYVYTSAPWTAAQSCWKLEYDQGGRPVSAALVEEDITGQDE